MLGDSKSGDIVVAGNHRVPVQHFGGRVPFCDNERARPPAGGGGVIQDVLSAKGNKKSLQTGSYADWR